MRNLALGKYPVEGIARGNFEPDFLLKLDLSECFDADGPSSISKPIDSLVRDRIERGKETSLVRARKRIARKFKERNPDQIDLTVLRMSKGLSQRELADRMGTHQPQISRLESGLENLGFETFVKLVAALDETPNKVFAALRVTRNNAS